MMKRPPALGSIVISPAEARRQDLEARRLHDAYEPARAAAHAACAAAGYRRIDRRIDGCMYHWQAEEQLIAVTDRGRCLRFELRADGHCYAVRV